MSMFDTSELLAALKAGDTARVKTKLDAQPNLLQSLTGPNGESLLLLAVQAGNPETVKYLLEQGADVNVTDPSGMTPLHAAAQQGDEEIILLLLKNKADINALTVDGQSPMELAIKNGHDAAKWFSL
jgi:ankyrin repeat protein